MERVNLVFWGPCLVPSHQQMTHSTTIWFGISEQFWKLLVFFPLMIFKFLIWDLFHSCCVLGNVIGPSMWSFTCHTVMIIHISKLPLFGKFCFSIAKLGVQMNHNANLLRTLTFLWHGCMKLWYANDSCRDDCADIVYFKLLSGSWTCSWIILLDVMPTLTQTCICICHEHCMKIIQ